jgi:hypothetical protein
MHKVARKDVKTFAEYFDLCFSLVNEPVNQRRMDCFVEKMWQRGKKNLYPGMWIVENKKLLITKPVPTKLNQNGAETPETADNIEIKDGYCICIGGKVKLTSIQQIVPLNLLLEQVFKKHQVGELQKAIFTQYVEYMNPESRYTFINKVMKGDYEYFSQFVDTELENFGDEYFQQKINQTERRKQTDLYDIKKPENLLLIYKGLILRLRQLDKDERRKVYQTKFKINLDRFDKKDVMGKRTMFYDHFKTFISSMKNKEKFIDDIFDKNAKVF